MRLFLLSLFIVLAFSSCDTSKSSSTSANNTTLIPNPPADYKSPTVQTLESAVVKPVELPADSIPVSYSTKGVALAPADFIPMIGKWQSTFDTDEIVRFVPGRYVSYYKGEQIVEEKMTYYHVCPPTCTGNENESIEQPCFVLASDYDQQCFTIINHTDDHLELSLVSGDGTRLIYQRMAQ